MIARIVKSFDRKAAHRRLMRAVEESACQVFPNREVLAGPFRGLRYPDWQKHGSAVFAKLLGTYEAELHSFVEAVMSAQPSTVVDIGCAEGYYAVGSARALPKAHVVAADLSNTAQQLCGRMAALNGVADRVEVVGRVTREDLLAFATSRRGWLISDCEGGEAGLFDEEVFRKLSAWFILIELHEFLVPGIEERLVAEASRTHAVEVVDSLDDYRRERRWPRRCLDGVPSEVRHEFYREGRPGLMRWICATPLSSGTA